MVGGDDLEDKFYRDHIADLLGDSKPALLEDLGFALGYGRLDNLEEINEEIQIHPPMDWSWNHLDPKLVSDATQKVKRILLENQGVLLMSIRIKLKVREFFSQVERDCCFASVIPRENGI